MSLPPSDPTIYRSLLLSGEDWIEHGFGTRHADPWGAAHRVDIVTLKQIHSNRVLAWNESAGNSGPCFGEGDALVSATAGPWMAVKTADCVPILFADRAARAIAAAHAGWRGTVAEISVGVLAEMKQRYGTRPENILAAIGPTIGECCFEVGAEVALQFRPWWPQLRNEEDSGQGKHRLNLVETIVRQLTQAGVPFRQIDADAASCTMCGDQFHSFRRDRERAGRMHSAIRIKPK